MRVAVTGGTGMLGREVVAELARRGHAVRSLSRREGVDLVTGDGLAGALDGVDAVVDASNAGPRRKPAAAVLLEGTSRLLEAERQAGVDHHVAVSVVGADRIPLGYYAIKTEQESRVRRGAPAWSIVRSTQFHGYVDHVLASVARYGVLPGAKLALQPVDQREVAVLLADTVEGEPTGTVVEFAGPEIRTLAAFARTWRLETGRRARILPLPVGGAALTFPGAWTGRTTFGDWLAARYGELPVPAPVASPA